MDLLLIVFFAAGFVAAGTANALFFWMQARLVEEGISAKQFLFVTDLLKLLKNYRAVARAKGWSLVPPVFFLLSAAAMFLFMVAFAVRLQYPNN